MAVISPAAPSSEEAENSGNGVDLGVSAGVDADVALDAEQRRRAALVVAGAARDLEEARTFLEMLGLDSLASSPP